MQKKTGPRSGGADKDTMTRPKEDAQPLTIKRKRDDTDGSDGTDTSRTTRPKRQKNSTDRYPCPLAERFGCDKTYGSKKIAKRHSKIHTGDITCPLAEKFKCNQYFRCTSEAEKHAKTHIKNTKDLLPCPLAKEIGCKRTFFNDRAAKKHAESHKLQSRCKFPCPLAEKLGCTWISPTAGVAKDHAKIHNPIIQAKQATKQEGSLLLPCLTCFTNGLICDINNTKGECSNCLEHNQLKTAEKNGRKKWKSCTPRGHTCQKPALRDELRLFNDGLPALDAVVSHNGYIRIPKADKTNSSSDELGKGTDESNHLCLSCDQQFPVSLFEPTAEERLLGHVGRHGICEACRAFNAKHSMQKKCQECGQTRPLSFFRRFENRYGSMTAAAETSDGDSGDIRKTCSTCRLYRLQRKRANDICTVPMCRYAVSRSLIPHAKMARHMELHKARGHLKGLETYPHPVEKQNDDVVEDGIEEGIVEDIMGDEIFENAVAGDPVTEYLEEAQTLHASLDQEETLQLLQQRDKQARLSQGMTFSNEEREKIRASNISFRDQRPEGRISSGSRCNRGHCCLGPRRVSSDGLVKEMCPHQAVIGLDTAYLRVWKQGRLISLSGRCVSCDEQLRLTELLEQLEILRDETLGESQCEYRNCFKPGWREAKYCEEHLICGLTQDKGSQLDKAALRHDVEGTQWTYGPAFEEVINRTAKIADGKMPGAMLVGLDLEFSPISDKVFEVGLCEYYSGKKLLNARIKHDCSESELHEPLDGFKQTHPVKKGISIRASKKVYGEDRGNCTDLLDVHAIAAQLRKCGITPQSIILTWHRNKRDLVLLRKFINEAGYNDDILPPDANCIPMVHQFRRNIPKNCPAALEILFPCLFEGHELVGQNHRAFPDTLQLRLMVMLFAELCKPLDQRDLSMLPKSKAIGDWLLEAKRERTLQRTPQQLKAQKQRDQRFLQSKKRKSTKDTGVVANTRRKAANNKQKEGFTQLKLDQYVTRGQR